MVLHTWNSSPWELQAWGDLGFEGHHGMHSEPEVISEIMFPKKQKQKNQTKTPQTHNQHALLTDGLSTLFYLYLSLHTSLKHVYFLNSV